MGSEIPKFGISQKANLRQEFECEQFIWAMNEIRAGKKRKAPQRCITKPADRAAQAQALREALSLGVSPPARKEWGCLSTQGLESLNKGKQVLAEGQMSGGCFGGSGQRGPGHPPSISCGTFRVPKATSACEAQGTNCKGPCSLCPVRHSEL